MNDYQYKIRVTSIILLIQTLLWIVFTALSMSQVESSWTYADYVSWASKSDFYFIGNYINATILTITTVVLFTFLYDFLKNKNEAYAILGLVFIPI